MKISFGDKHTSLGDVLATIYCFENLGRQTGEEFEIHGHCFLNVLPLFDLQWLRYASRADGALDILDYLIPIPHRPDDCHHWIVFLQEWLSAEFLCYDASSLRPLVPGFFCGGQQGDEVLVQFDGDAAMRKGRSLDVGEMRTAIRLWSESENISVLGGSNTTRYLGDHFRYQLGDVRFLITQMLRCKHFLGTDSGMSHLAGVLGVRSKVIILHGQECISRFYATMYPATTFFDRRDLQHKLLL
jgi:hypothetical protein